MTPFVKTRVFIDQEKQQRIIELLAKHSSLPIDAIQKEFNDVLNNTEDNHYINDSYLVKVEEVKLTGIFPDMYCLCIRRLDRKPIHNWSDLQKIKNEIIGSEHEGLEIYPAESRLVDTAHQYYLWVFQSPNIRLPFGFNERFVLSDEQINQLHHEN